MTVCASPLGAVGCHAGHAWTAGDSSGIWRWMRSPVKAATMAREKENVDTTDTLPVDQDKYESSVGINRRRRNEEEPKIWGDR